MHPAWIVVANHSATAAMWKPSVLISGAPMTRWRKFWMNRSVFSLSRLPVR
jgi:hypothetical protein